MPERNIQVYPEFKKKIFDTLETILDNEEKLKLEEVWLFGSVAREEATYNSDIDLLVITSGKSKEVSFIIEDLDIRDDVNFPHVDVVVRTYKELGDPYFVFNEEVKRDKITLWKKVEK